MDNRTWVFVWSARAPHSEWKTMPGADANPYLAFAAAVLSEERRVWMNLWTAPRITKETPTATPASLPCRQVLLQTTDLLRRQSVGSKAFGPEVVEFYVHTARLEIQAYNQAITDWEKRRYFEEDLDVDASGDPHIVRSNELHQARIQITLQQNSRRHQRIDLLFAFITPYIGLDHDSVSLGTGQSLIPCPDGHPLFPGLCTKARTFSAAGPWLASMLRGMPTRMSFN